MGSSCSSHVFTLTGLLFSIDYIKSGQLPLSSYVYYDGKPLISNNPEWGAVLWLLSGPLLNPNELISFRVATKGAVNAMQRFENPCLIIQVIIKENKAFPKGDRDLGVINLTDPPRRINCGNKQKACGNRG